MVIFSDSRCLAYERPGHPERSQRISITRNFLEQKYPNWEWKTPQQSSLSDVYRVHSESHLARFSKEEDFDSDTAWYPGILNHALLSAGSAIAAMRGAREGVKCFSLMRPPGHHASARRVMGFCYLNSVVIAARAALDEGVKNVAIWDFDAHHGNGTEDLVAGDERIVFASVHQLPGWPGSGADSHGNIRNYPVAPHSPRLLHREILRESLDDLIATDPKLLLVSAGFDAYAGDPITEMSLLLEDYEELGRWLHNVSLPVACILEGGYSGDLPLLIGSFLEKWENG